MGKWAVRPGKERRLERWASDGGLGALNAGKET